MNAIQLIKSFWVLVVGLAMLTTSCRSKRSLQKSQPPAVVQPPVVVQPTAADTVVPTKPNLKDTIPQAPAIDSAAIAGQLYEQVMAGTYQFSTFSAKAKVDYADAAGNGQNATAQVRIAKDSLIWISLTGTLGIEGVRAIIRPDSVFIMDKLKKTITRTSVDWLVQTTGLPFGFADVQNLLLGHPVFFKAPLAAFTKDSNLVKLLSAQDIFSHWLTYDADKQTILQSNIKDTQPGSQRSCQISFNSYQPVQGKNFSTLRNITIEDKSKLNVLLDYKQVSFNETLSFPFNVPKSYTSK